MKQITISELAKLKSQLDYAIFLHHDPGADENTRPMTEQEKKEIADRYGEDAVLIGDFVIKRR